MKLKISEASGPALDWMVAKCEGETEVVQFSALASSKHYFAPSRKWAQGGPIIEREFIEVTVTACGYTGKARDTWTAYKGVPDADGIEAYGPSPLIAAMRCYVASQGWHNGEVDVPEELV